MNHINVTFTSTKRLNKPQPLPEVTEAEARSWFNGMWHGIAISAPIWTAVGVLVAQHFGG